MKMSSREEEEERETNALWSKLQDLHFDCIQFKHCDLLKL